MKLSLEEIERKLVKMVAGNHDIENQVFFVDIHAALADDVKSIMEKHNFLQQQLRDHLMRP
jgi:hypothetical protein